MAELLSIVNNLIKVFRIEDLMNQKIGIEINSKEELIDLLNTSKRNNFRTPDSKIWDIYVEGYNKNRYKGSACVIFNDESISFCDTDYYRYKVYEIYQYKDIKLIDRVLI